MNDFFTWQIEHYTQRLQEAREGGNVKEIAFLRETLFNLKKS